MSVGGVIMIADGVFMITGGEIMSAGCMFMITGTAVPIAMPCFKSKFPGTHTIVRN